MKHRTIEFAVRTAIKAVLVALVLSFGLVTASDAQSKMKGQTTGAASSTSYEIREKCVAEAQARYPDTGLGTATVMEQRKGVYMDCAKRSGIRP